MPFPDTPNKLLNFLVNLGLSKNQHIVVHSSLRALKDTFPDISPAMFIQALQEIVSLEGSIIFPAFTYCFKRSSGDYLSFDYAKSPSVVGSISEHFRTSNGVIRTSSPTHSFSLWGAVCNDISFENSPQSPLGKNSVMNWLADKENSFVLMLGCGFESLTYLHYVENMQKLPFLDDLPWKYMNVLPVGVSISNEQKQIEIPGCAKSFSRFEEFLILSGVITSNFEANLKSYFVHTKLLLEKGTEYLSKDIRGFLCKKYECQSCKERHEYLDSNKFK